MRLNNIAIGESLTTNTWNISHPEQGNYDTFVSYYFNHNKNKLPLTITGLAENYTGSSPNLFDCFKGGSGNRAATPDLQSIRVDLTRFGSGTRAVVIAAVFKG
jgi:hypothetical protein